MNDASSGQVIHSAAEVYDRFFLPALFHEWADPMVQAARIQPGQKVLDVACGTGVLSLAAAEAAGPGGEVVGLDINEGMLAVARKKATQIEWRQGRAESLPFKDESFDAVVSQFGLMFFEDRRGAIKEMARVLRPGGRLAVAVWDSLDNTPGYAKVTDLLAQLFDDETAAALHAPYILGDKQVLEPLFAGSELEGLTIETLEGTAQFPSIESWMYTDVKGWTLAERLNDDDFDLLQQAASKELRSFVGEDGTVRFSAPAHIVSATKAL